MALQRSANVLWQIVKRLPARIITSGAVVSRFTELQFEHWMNLPVVNSDQVESNEMLGVEHQQPC